MTTFNNLTSGETLDQFSSFYVAPCRNAAKNDIDGTEIIQCEVGWAEFWGIYGWVDGQGSMAVHDADSATEAVRIAKQIAIKTGKPVAIHEERHGIASANTDFTRLAEDVTDWIWDDLPDADSLDARCDDFDHHALAELREALVTYSDYSGRDTARDPHLPIEGEAA